MMKKFRKLIENEMNKYWDPNYIRELSKNEIETIVYHEKLHLESIKNMSKDEKEIVLKYLDDWKVFGKLSVN
jgi:hypothetical protein